HRIIISHYSEDHIRCCSNLRQILRGCAAKFCSKRGRSRAVYVLNGGNVKLPILQSARHVCAHPAHSNKTDVHEIKLFRQKMDCAVSLRLPWSWGRVPGK